MKRWLYGAAAGALALVALVEGGRAGLIAAKAFAAPVLIEAAFERSAETGKPEKPWPWADATPRWQLTAPAVGLDRFVLEGATMRALAFGPVHQRMGAAHLVFGHRDTHFAALGRLIEGDLIVTAEPGGHTREWRVERHWVADEDALYVPGGGDEAGLLLVTCFPFDAITAGGKGRYLVWAVPK